MVRDATIQGSVQARLWLRLGAELVVEPWTADDCATIARSTQDAAGRRLADVGVDGALSLRADGADLCRDDLWDRLDGLLLAWLKGIDALSRDADAVTVEFPDTRIEAKLSQRDDHGTAQLHVAYEDIDAEVPRDALRAALEAAAQRLVAALGPCTPALRELAARTP